MKHLGTLADAGMVAKERHGREVDYRLESAPLGEAAAIALVFRAEKNWRHGAVLTRVVGGAVAALGLAVAAVPPLLSAISR